MEAEMVPSVSPLLQAADQWHELLLLLPVLVALELVLSADNAIALAAISRRLHDPARQRQALNLGLLLALLLRFLLILASRWVLSAWPLQLLASAYLLWLCGSHLIGLDRPDEETEAGSSAPAVDASAAAEAAGAVAPDPAAGALTGESSPAAPASAPDGGRPEPSLAAGPTLASVALTLGLTDLAFSLDSVAAAVAVTDQIALVMLGGLLGVVSLRLTAGLFVRWLELFQHLETAGYLAVGLVGIRLLLRLLLPDLEVPEWGLLLIVAALFLWGFSERSDAAAAGGSGDDG